MSELYSQKEISEMLKEFEVYKKAFELMAVKYCKHTACYFCEVNDYCEMYCGERKGFEFLKEYFLQEARKE